MVTIILRIRRLTLVLLVGLISVCSSSALAKSTEQYPYFEHDGHRLAAYFKSPDDKDSVKGVVLFVSGDGATPYDAHGYYDAIWQVFLDAGYAVFSWDKPGVGESSGNWREQSMFDRQNEVRAAMDFVKHNYRKEAKTIGIMGFSQAGWVVPALMQNNPEVSFMVGVGYAINWLEQSWFMTEMRLQRQGASAEMLKQEQVKFQQERAFWQSNPNYDAYVRLFLNNEQAIDKERFEFIKKNVLSDATQDYVGLTQPMLILLGENDEHVDGKQTFNTLTSLYRGQSNATIKMIPNATHALLKYPNVDSQTNGIVLLAKLWLLGDSLYAPDFFGTLSSWLEALDLPGK
ncbi:alpha/beta hydrolase [Vibrio sp. 05-20-BW147]|uniref:alpha/beta hydrolase family protein n=1 Tax=Vibrio sp. 05-20-BW147 TaxID=2575834 RepID=UPI0015940691|nr:alpha/beta hydrolase [Vibrio sp. 05-20-BW147]NVC64937.1 alpha/beta hydrolase [Vibrio sp. 05-20-BW147]